MVGEKSGGNNKKQVLKKWNIHDFCTYFLKKIYTNIFYKREGSLELTRMVFGWMLDGSEARQMQNLKLRRDDC